MIAWVTQISELFTINMGTNLLNNINSIIDSTIDRMMYLPRLLNFYYYYYYYNYYYYYYYYYFINRIYSIYFSVVDFLKMDKMVLIIVRTNSVVIREEDNTNNNKMVIINNSIDRDLLFGRWYLYFWLCSLHLFFQCLKGNKFILINTTVIILLGEQQMCSRLK
jgi:hypothetical protein